MNLINPKIERIKVCLPQMGLIDRFFYLVKELYDDYFAHFESYSKNESDFFYKEVYGKWEKLPEKLEDRKGAGMDSLKYRFLQEFGNRQLSNFILTEIRQLISIFSSKYSFEMSYQFNKPHARKYSLSKNADFLLLAPFIYDEVTFRDAIHHELATSEIEDRGFLLNKYQGVLSEIEYRINSNFVWDASLEDIREQETYGMVFPLRRVIDLNKYASFLRELSENPLDPISNKIDGQDDNKTEERLVLKGVRLETVVKTFARVLDRAGEENLIRNFVAVIFRYNFRRDSFDHEVTDDFLKLKSSEDTYRICQTIILMKSLSFIQIPDDSMVRNNALIKNDSHIQNDSFIMRVVVPALNKKGQKRNVLLSDNLRKVLRECHGMTRDELSQAMGFSSEKDFVKFLAGAE